MKKYLLICLVLTLSMMAFGQELKERRVYYLDCSYSMVQKGLWEPVLNDLVNSVKMVNDEKTELMIIPFAYDNTPFRHGKLKPIKAMADEKGKKMLVDKVLSLNEPQKSTKTYLRDPLCDFYGQQRVSPAKVTYMFLMTDGMDEEQPAALFKNELMRWGSHYGDKNVYGFYVMLDSEAKSQEIEKIVKNQPHLWKVEKANVNINLVRLHNRGVFNARNERYFDLPVYGDIKGKTIKAQFSDEAPCQVTKVEKVDGKMRFYVKNKKDVHKMAPSAAYELHISMSGGGPFDILVTDKVRIQILSKPERSLKINML